MLLFYVRHGDPIYSPDSLTPLGKRQAEAVAKRLAVYGVDKIYSSTSNRAYETAVPLSELTKKEITQIDFFNESYAWKYFTAIDKDHKTKWVESIPSFREVFSSDAILKLGLEWYKFPDFKECKFKEGMEFYNRNIDDFFRLLGYEHDRKKHTYQPIGENPDRVAIFAHGGFGGVFLSSVLDIPYPIYATHYRMSHTGVTVIEFNHQTDKIIPQILQFANDSHLYQENLPTYFCNEIPI